MDDFWWQLPGPQYFVRHIGEDLRAGKSVCLGLPATLSTLELRRAISDYVREQCDSSLEDCSLGDLALDSMTIPEALVQSFDLATDDFSEMHNLKFLVNSPKFAGKIIWVRDLENVSYPIRQQWLAFLQEFAHTSRMRVPLYRTVFCVVLSGQVTLEAPVSDVLLSVHWWWNTVSRLDMALYVRNRALFKGIGDSVTEPVLAELAGFDCELAAVLTDGRNAEIEDWESILVEYGLRQGWPSGVSISKASLSDRNSTNLLDLSPEIRDWWARGMLNSISGEGLHVHSAVVASNGTAHEIERRIWRAQVRLLLPYVDEQRIAVCSYLFQRYGLAQMDLVVSTESEAYAQLEIGDLKRLLDKRFKCEPEPIRELVRWLHYVRNQVAHLKILSQAEIERCYHLVNSAEAYMLDVPSLA